MLGKNGVAVLPASSNYKFEQHEHRLAATRNSTCCCQGGRTFHYTAFCPLYLSCPFLVAGVVLFQNFFSSPACFRIPFAVCLDFIFESIGNFIPVIGLYQISWLFLFPGEKRNNHVLVEFFLHLLKNQTLTTICFSNIAAFTN
jgi:hypothetical protein